MSTKPTNEKQLLSVLEDTASVLQKTQVNLKKCPKARLTKGYIESRMHIIEDYWKTFKIAHQDLVKITPKERKGALPYFLNEEFFIYEDLYSVLQADLKDMLIKLAETSALEARSANECSNMPRNNFVHLPKIQLPKFSGSYESWQTFQDLFISLVHNNTCLSDVQKLHYLKTSVTEEAETLLKHIQVTANNYSHAWEILKTRYGNKRFILNGIMKRLFSQKKMNTQSAVQLKNLLDTTTECLNTLKNLDISIASWDPLLIYLLVQKMDPETHKNWEEYAYKEESEIVPTWSDMTKFMESKFRTLELTHPTSTKDSRPVKERSYHVATPVTNKVCIMCKDNHTLSHCKELSQMEPTQRREFVRNKELCFNCLVPGHSAFKCRVPMSCRVCNRRHHSLLHEKRDMQSGNLSLTSQPAVTHVEEQEEVEVNAMMTSHFNTKQKVALLATAVVEARNEHGHTILLRALIDQGSEAAFISERAAQQLKLERQTVRGSVVGVGSNKTEIKHMVQLQVRSRLDHNFNLPVKAYVMSKQLTTRIPTKTITTQQWFHIQGLNLADPTYFTPGSIDLLLGVKEYAEILENNFIKGPPGEPSAQKTSLGWILFGEICSKEQEDTFVVMHHSLDVDDMLKLFWEIDVDTNRKLTIEEQLCEDIYNKTTTRNQEGRYIVKLPFKTYSPLSPKGNTKEIATQRFIQLEKKFRRSPELKQEYTKVINDYVEQGHMEKVPEKEKDKRSVYLPHHAVVRADKESTRTRVVFDASCRGTNNVSLNDELYVGPQLQEDLRNIMIRWRLKQVGFVADIKQMYRQILVTKDDADFQRIVWRQNESDVLEEYRLLRVTFGTAPAPYLAVKTLQQIAKDHARGTLTAQTIIEDFYMDDLVSCEDTAEAAIFLAKHMTETLKKGGFDLTKWSSNNIEFMKAIDKNKRSPNIHVDLNLDGTIKTLGIVWDLNKDMFHYKVNLPSVTTPITKRNILSDLQKIYDPLGWIAPSTVMAKILIQKLWLEKVNWDDKVSNTLEEEWRQIRSDFANINKIQIERWFGTMTKDIDKIQLHGFCDASMQAYAAAVYLRLETSDEKVTTKLIAARTRVAPLKTISLPRLELCGALLLSKLLKQVGQAMRLSTSQMYAWTDSSIVIAWLGGEPNRWKQFVANRVVEIVENINNKHWYHVQSNENPVDLGTRGMLLAELEECVLWWQGPSWLSETKINISKQEIVETDMKMKTTKIKTYLNTENTEQQEKAITSQFENFDSLTELIKTISYCRRFLNYRKNIAKSNSSLTTQELEEALYICIRRAQEEYYEEIERLKMKKQVKKKHQLRSLNPYLDKQNILRVGGRLRHANLSPDQKNPIILGSKNMLTPLIIADAHSKTLHGGVQLMLCYLRFKYWIIRAKSLVKKCVHKCMKCARLNATTKAQIMGDLPAARVNPTRPFLHSGVDFAGPFQTLMSKGRGNKTTKTYISIFICMSTKAIHIELVGDLTSEAFISAFRRFVARRGKCSHLWCDHGRNFVGANKQLYEAWNEANLQLTGEVAATLATDGTQFHFIPPYSPNFGGLWEAGVKSIKYHLKRILTTHLTYEEMTTVLCQIEAVLNSRPLCPMDDIDTNDVNPLTPGHFLIGEAPIIVPSPDLQAVKIHTLSRWQYTQKLLNDFWKRWQDEYLSRLQQRPKWLKKENEFTIGDIVLIKIENLPPGKWSLGRITDKHPGTDGYTRVYSVKCGSSITRRSVTKLCALPVDYT